MRKLIAAIWIMGSAATALILATFLFGCCALPFHRVLHRAFPICSYAVGILTGGHHGGHGRDATPATPAQSKAAPAIAKVLPAKVDAWSSGLASQRLLLSPTAQNERALPTLKSLGALRIDDDIGLHSLFDTFLI
jgi:hypothetical protein